MDIRQELGVRKVPYQVLDLREEAAALDEQPETEHTTQLARVVLLRTPRGYATALVPALCRIDLGEAARALRVDRVAIASQEELRWVLQDEVATRMTPFGSSFGLPTLVDGLLRSEGKIVFEGAGDQEGVVVKYEDFEAIEHPILARFTHSIGHLGHSWFPEDRLP